MSADRRERADAIARHLSAKVNAVAPRGLGAWDHAWRVVEEPSNAFLDALHDWEESGSAADRQRVKETAERVMAAWRHAATLWEAAGKPRSWPSQEVVGAS